MALEKYKRVRNRVFFYVILVAVLASFAIYTGYTIIAIPDILADPKIGIVTTISICIFSVSIASIFAIPLFALIYGWFFPVIAALFGINAASKAILKKLKSAPVNDNSFTEIIRKHDPDFSISNFYSGLQNKISSVIFADTEEQLHAFADVKLPDMFGHYNDVINVDVEYMGIVDYSVRDSLQYASVNADLKLTRYKNEKCRHYKEHWVIELVKAADCRTQIICSPKVMTCGSCGSSLDLLRGKTCSSCGNELNLMQFDWVIHKIER